MLDIVKGHSSGLMRTVVDMDMIATQLLQNIGAISGIIKQRYVRFEPGSKGEFDLGFQSSILCENPVLLQ